MSTANNRRAQPGRGSEVLMPWIIIAVVVVGGGTVYAGAHGGHALAGLPAPPTNPLDVMFGVAQGEVAWPTASTVVAGGVIAALLLLLLGVGLWRGRRGRKSTRVDPQGRYMGAGRDIEPISRRSVQATAVRLGVDKNSPGVPIGRAVSTRAPLMGSWEDMHVDIWGPRTGKTTARAIPAILEAPGAVIVTSNKRDVVDATRDPRSQVGPVWVFDPQGVSGEQPSWWWNPLSYVVDEVKAAKLAEHFAAGSRDPGARTDAFFDPAGQDLLAGLLLAAACDRRPITDVYRWLSRPHDDQAVDILKEHGYDLTADQVAGVIDSPDKQRGGIYGTAMQMASCLTNRAVSRWVTPQGQVDSRPQLDPHAFVAGTGTLYSLSREGRGTAGPLVTALTVALVEAAEERAAVSPRGRLSVPLLGVLDEAANVCRWRDLPNLYSHYGSRGIVLMTILQSWSQGCDVWGESGMRKLWSAANVAVYGGGVKEDAFLESLSKMIGDYDKRVASVSTTRGQRTVSEQLHRERILDVSDLGALPKGRAIVMASGARPTLIATQPWMATRHASAVEASIGAHDPQADRTIEELHTDYEASQRQLQRSGYLEGSADAGSR